MAIVIWCELSSSFSRAQIYTKPYCLSTVFAPLCMIPFINFDSGSIIMIMIIINYYSCYNYCCY